MDGSLLDQIRKLPLAERIELVEDVWDSIAAEAAELPVPESHREELARRREAHREQPGRALPWEEARRRLWSEE
jgi:putative addiction module component (TIGR02574 family)